MSTTAPFLGPSSPDVPDQPVVDPRTVVPTRTAVHLTGKYVTIPYEALFLPMFEVFTKYCSGQLITIEEASKHVEHARRDAQQAVLSRLNQAVTGQSVSLARPHGEPPLPLEFQPRSVSDVLLPGGDDDSDDDTPDGLPPDYGPWGDVPNPSRGG